MTSLPWQSGLQSQQSCTIALAHSVGRRKDGAIGQVTIGLKQNPVCVPGNSAIAVLGWTKKISPKITCLVEQVQHHNLPPGIVINRCVATTKARSVPVIFC